jgi:hypothetical protein
MCSYEQSQSLKDLLLSSLLLQRLGFDPVSDQVRFVADSDNDTSVVMSTSPNPIANRFLSATNALHFSGPRNIHTEYFRRVRLTL